MRTYSGFLAVVIMRDFADITMINSLRIYRALREHQSNCKKKATTCVIAF
jgi:hypothetical protein